MLTRSKYKVLTPEDTISKAQKILSSIGIETHLKQIQTFDNGISCRLIVTNDNLESFNIGTNGKGMTLKYAIASAYGEMLERIENKVLFRTNLLYATERYIKEKPYNSWTDNLQKKNLILSFQYYPDEREYILTRKEVKEQIIPRFFPSYDNKITLTDEYYRTIFAPFDDLTNDEQVMVPVEYCRAIVGTNGLCAGNSKEEAIIQGLNEVCERYVLMRLYTEHIYLPRINLCVFEGHEIFHRLKKLENDYDVIICDCSLNEHIPVIGLLLIDRKKSSYAFKLGADFNMISALERCYTEMFQGKNNHSQIFRPYTGEDSLLDAMQYHDALFTGTGNIPHSVLIDPHIKSRFPHHDFKTYEEEFNTYVNLFRNKRMSVYVKDNSFLGFPAYTIYVPGYSEIDTRLFNVDKMLHKKQCKYKGINALLNIANALSANRAEDIIEELDTDNMLHLQAWNSAPSAKIFSKLLGTYTYAYKKDFISAYRQLTEFINILQDTIDIPIDIKCTDNILYLLKQNDTNSFEYLKIIYGEKLFTTILHRLNNITEYFMTLPVPTCFNCGKCSIKNTCHMEQIVNIEKRLQDRQIKFSGYKN